MLDEFQFDDRAKALYDSQRAMAYKDGAKLPFNREQFTLWLWRQMGGGSGPSADALKARLCPYGCNRPIDVLNISIDHMVPRGQQGSYALENLLPCCVDCQTLKGNMTAHSYKILLAAGREMYPKDWELLRKRIIIGGTAQQDKWRRIRAERQLKGKGKPVKPQPLDFNYDPKF